MMYKNSRAYAKNLDQQDPLAKYREEFFYPKNNNGEDVIYLCGNSLGLQHKSIKDKIESANSAVPPFSALK